MLLCFSFTTAICAHSVAQDPVDDAFSAGSRTWTFAENGSHLHGIFVSSKEGKVVLQLEGGKIISIMLEKLVESDRKWIDDRIASIKRMNEFAPILVSVQKPSDEKPPSVSEQTGIPAIHQHFLPFKDSLGLKWDDQFYYVESNGLPDHAMMIGITAWQQQVPLPQNYTGNNAWRIPLTPIPAKQVLSAKTGFFRGAIALAVNGVPIFNPIKNDGRTDTLLAGELDQWGGHCGRADDYHYHIAPVHLEQFVGPGQPIAYALDGYPILGYQTKTPNDSLPLDPLNGHMDALGHYHYHATRNYPYLNGGFFGEVIERNGQVDPQPRAEGVRPSLTSLRGAKITGFYRSENNKNWRVDYDHLGEQRSVGYVINEDLSVSFTFNDGSDGVRKETFTPRQQRNQGDSRWTPRNQTNPKGGQRPSRGRRPNNDQNPRANPGALDTGGSRRLEQNADRRPWIEIHAREMDLDLDGVLTLMELRAEADHAFVSYAPDQSGKISLEKLASSRPVRSPMGGFIKDHREELDADRDGNLIQSEVLQVALKMFRKADTDQDARIIISSIDSINTTSSSDISNPPIPLQPLEKRSDGHTSNVDAPSIVLVLMDDMGWRDVGFAGNTFVETPNINRLAIEGVQFTEAYANAPNCAPTRACLLSGQYTPRHGIYTVVDPRHGPGQPQHRIISASSKSSLSSDTVTIAEVLKKKGYATACFGMWNLGRGRNGPTSANGQGFDLYRKPQDLGFGQNAYFSEDGRYLTDALFDEGIHFIEQHFKERFFLYLPTHAVHSPFDPNPELVEKYRKKARQPAHNSEDPVYAAMIDSVDQNIGRLLSCLERLDLVDNTMLVFTSDNGGTPQYVAPLNGSKGALYEGGIRVPCAIWWKGISNPGRLCDDPILSMDFFPTIAELAGADLPGQQEIDGQSLVPVLRQSDKLPQRDIFWHFPCYVGRGRPSSAIRSGDWKLIQQFEDSSLELFNLQEDPGESNNLSAELPEKANEMLAKLSRWQIALSAPHSFDMNPNFDPNYIRRTRRK